MSQRQTLGVVFGALRARRYSLPYAEGVLVPSALTDDALLACGVDPESRESPVERAEVAASVRERLERIARGEV